MITLLLTLTAQAANLGPWQCEAIGYDFRRWPFTVTGERQLLQWQAEDSALRACVAQGYDDCRVVKCEEKP